MQDGTAISAAEVDEGMVWVRLSDGRVLGTPLTWYPKLLAGTPAARSDLEISPSGVHWPALDEDLGLRGMLAGSPAPGGASPQTPTHTSVFGRGPRNLG